MTPARNSEPAVTGFDRAAHLRRINDRSRAEAQQRRAWLVEDVEFLNGTLTEPDQIAARLGLTVAAIDIALRRAGRWDLARPFSNSVQRDRYHRRKAIA